SPMSPAGQRLVVTAFAVGLGLPLCLLVLGVDSGFAALEKRPPARIPGWSIGSSVEPAFYADVAHAFADRVPLRVEAVVLDAWLDVELFGDSPNPEVLLGADGWLFRRQAVVGPRRPEALERAVDTVGRVSRILATSGRQLVFLVAPDKAAIYPEKLGPSADLARPGSLSRQRARALLQEAEMPGYLDLWTAMEQLKQVSAETTYWPRDTHWKPESIVEGARLIAGALDPALWDADAVAVEPGMRHRSDLAGMIGLPRQEQGTSYEVRRNVEVRRAGAADKSPVRLVTHGAEPLFRPRVLAVTDSFGDDWLGILSQYFADSTWISWSELPRERLVSIVNELARTEVVIIETVERAMIGRWSRRSRGLPSHLVARLLDDLPSTPLELPPAASGPSQIRLQPALSAAQRSESERYLVLDLAADESAARRLRVEARDPRDWQRVPSRVVPYAGGWRVVSPLPAGTRQLMIRPSLASVAAARVVDIAG
ncbi:MAG: hypothetical protein AAF560_29695, partial [Acidobacteriota bacterium]